MKTREELERLKSDWIETGWFDIEDVAEYPEWAEFREELLSFAAEKQAQWKSQREREEEAHEQRKKSFMKELNLSENKILAEYIYYLNNRMLYLEGEVKRLINGDYNRHEY